MVEFLKKYGQKIAKNPRKNARFFCRGQPWAVPGLLRNIAERYISTAQNALRAEKTGLVIQIYPRTEKPLKTALRVSQRKGHKNSSPDRVGEHEKTPGSIRGLFLLYVESVYFHFGSITFPFAMNTDPGPRVSAKKLMFSAHGAAQVNFIHNSFPPLEKAPGLPGPLFNIV